MGAFDSGLGTLGGALVASLPAGAFVDCSDAGMWCPLGWVVVGAMAGSAVGSVLGVRAAAKYADRRFSWIGGFIGGTLGVLAGGAALHVLDDRAWMGVATAALTYTVTQGLFTTAGSEFVAALP